jgi:diaminopimelate epimerase
MQKRNVSMKSRTFVITAAGGNGTAIRVLEHPLSRAEYASQGKQLLQEMENFGAEQAGFLIPENNHFEMAGGEFCGNGSRSAAILFSEIQQKPKVSFTVSGFNGTVTAKVTKTSDKIYFVEGIFPGLLAVRKDVVLSNNQPATIVDLGGIVHVVIEASFPSKADVYRAIHHSITRELNFENRSCVGVIWIEHLKKAVKMHPVVWVKEVDSFFYEQSCGSGTIAVSKVTGIPSVIQPTGKKIEAEITPKAVVLKSEMEVVYIGD